MKKIIDRIAREILRLETLERRNSDSLDFHDLSVSEIEMLLKPPTSPAPEQGSRTPHVHRPAERPATTYSPPSIVANEEYDTGALDIIEPSTEGLS